jgi:nucleotide-binding universal stress UspA family protein
MKKILIAIDGSECALKAVYYVGQYYANVRDLKMTLLHVIPYPPAPLWDDGHILTSAEKEARESVINKWLANQRLKIQPMFEEAVRTLTREGVDSQRVETKTISDSTDVAESILEETRDGGYPTLVLGRCGLSLSKRFMGSVTNKIINHGSGTAICVVE